MTEPEIHPTAAVHPAAQLGPGCRIGPFAVIEENVVMGSGCLVAAHAVIKSGTVLGDANQVFEGAVLGGPPQDLKYRDGISFFKAGHRNVFREGVTVNRATGEGAATTLGNDNYLMTLSHVAHECILGDQIVLANSVALAGHVEVHDRAFLSGGVVVHQFSRIGRQAMVGGNAKVQQDVLPFFLADGVPARMRGLNLVGLRRAGFTPAQMKALKEAFRILANPQWKKDRKLELLAQLESPEVERLSDFIRGSERSFCRFGRAE